MKKVRIFPLLLALLLLLNLGLPAFAVEDGEEAPSAAAEETLPGETVPGETEPLAVAPGLTDDDLGANAGRALAPASALDLDVHAALLYEMNSGTMVYANNIDAQVYPASLTKVMTCLVALEKGNLEDTVTVSDTALEDMDPAGSNVALQAGEKMSLHELLYCAMLASGNDACVVIAEHIAGSEEAFVQLMNEEAQRLGCTGTHFANSHGLHDEAH